MRRSITRKRVAIATVLGIAAVAIYLVVDHALMVPQQEPAKDTPLPPVAEEPLTRTNLAEIKELLGPFETIPVSADSPNPDTQDPAVLILNQDGSTEASQAWTIPFDSSSWNQQDAFQIRSLSVQLGYVTIGTNRQRTFVVKANQPFVFEDVPEQVHVIDAQGNTWSTTTARAAALRQNLK